MGRVARQINLCRWSKVDSGINADAFDFARRLLDRQGLQDVKIEPTRVS